MQCLCHALWSVEVYRHIITISEKMLSYYSVVILENMTNANSSDKVCTVYMIVEWTFAHKSHS